VKITIEEITSVTSQVNLFASEIDTGSREISREMQGLMKVTEDNKTATGESKEALRNIAQATKNMSILSGENKESIQGIFDGFAVFKLKQN